MLTKKRRLLFLICAVLSFISATGFSTTFDWDRSHAKSIILDDPYIDMALRVSLIDRAEQNIKMAMFYQSPDYQSTIPILNALRRAANRGVKIQIITAAWPIQVELNTLVERMLIDGSLRRPIEYLKFGGTANQDRGWNISDTSHEKILLVDDRYSIIGGRNHGNFVYTWFDYAFLVYGSQPLLSQIRQAFNQLWFDLTAVVAPITGASVDHSDFPSSVLGIPLSQNQQSTLNQILSAVFENQSAPSLVHNLYAARVISHRFFHHLASNHYRTAEQRLRMPDDVVNEATQKILNANQIRLTSQFIMLHPMLKNALKVALQNGKSVKIHMNSEDSASETTPFGVSYADSLPDLVELMRVRKADGSPGNLEVVTFKRNSLPETGITQVYTHRKILITDDVVFFGSHNYNLPSTIANSEIAVEVADQMFAQAMRTRYDAAFERFGIPLSEHQASEQLNGSGFARWIAKFIEGFL